MRHGITQCYLPPGRSDIPALTPAEAGTRLSDPGGIQGRVDLLMRCVVCVLDAAGCSGRRAESAHARQAADVVREAAAALEARRRRLLGPRSPSAHLPARRSHDLHLPRRHPTRASRRLLCPVLTNELQ